MQVFVLFVFVNGPFKVHTSTFFEEETDICRYLFDSFFVLFFSASYNTVGNLNML